MGILNAIADFLFPDKCLSCGREGQNPCERCLSEFPGAERPGPDWVYSLYDYRHPKVKQTIHALKYGKKKRIAKVLGEPLLERILEELADLEQMENFIEPILIPIPLSRTKQRERGFNQTELLARAAGAELEMNTKILKRVKDSTPQARIRDRRERLANAEDIFAVVRPDAVRGRNIILIDDVITTGATLTEARKALKHSGARKVVAFTIAH